MKTLLLSLLYLIFLAAWTIEIDIGKANIADAQSENIHLQAHSDNGLDWKIEAQAPWLKQGKQRWQQLQASAWLHYQDGQFFLREPQLSAKANHSQLFLFSPQRIALNPHLALSPLSLHIHTQKKGNELLQLHWLGKPRELRLEKNKLTAKEFNELLKFLHLPPIKHLDGNINTKLLLKQSAHQWQLTGNIEFNLRDWHSANHLQALANLQANVQLNLHYTQTQGWQGNISAHLTQGEALIQPFYLNFSQAPLHIDSQWQYHNQQLQIKKLSAYDDALQLSATLNYDLSSAQLKRITIQQFSGKAEALYQRFIKPLLSPDNLFADSNWQGSFFASSNWHHQQGLSDTAIVLHHLNIQDRQQRFHFPDIDGQIGQGGESRLDISASTWRKLPLGASTLRLHWQENRIRLLHPWKLPILNGALIVNQLEQDAQQQFLLNISLEPINLAELSQALELPIFHGDISAELPEVRLSKDSLVLNEPVHMNIFGGHVLISDLRIERFLSAQALLNFSLGLNLIELQRLTSAFEIAEIRGRVSGYITNVTLINWQPVAFDASIMTDHDYPSERRISHEAVQMLTQIGGSSAAIGQFVRVLNSFPYEKLGFSAKLRGDNLHIDGVEEHPSGGFYLVKGRGIPHLDIIGHQRDSSYREIIQRLKSAQQSESPVIQ